jgi:hypothetical protein
MDEARIDALAKEVLSSLKSARPIPAPGSSEAPRRIPVAFGGEAAEALLSVEGGRPGEPCVLDAGQVCVGTLRCRSLGH